jgi:nucleotide-binding universal stress UspA family protein
VRVVGATEGDLASIQDPEGPPESTDPKPDQPTIAAAAAARDLERRGLSAEFVLRGGDPVTAILNEVEAVDADLVVLGSRGLGRLEAMLTGSVASGVLDQAPCPVLVARAPRFTKILLATDGSEASDAATDAVAEWTIFEGIDVEVLSVGTSAADDAAATSEHRRVAEAAAVRLRGGGRRAVPHVRSGDAATAIVAFAEERSTELIVLGSRGHTALKRTLVGSVTRDVLASTEASVLVVQSLR